jgi:hypothetical protein
MQHQDKECPCWDLADDLLRFLKEHPSGIKRNVVQCALIQCLAGSIVTADNLTREMIIVEGLLSANITSLLEAKRHG